MFLIGQVLIWWSLVRLWSPDVLAFAFARTIGPVRGTFQATKRFSREDWVGRNSRFCVDKVDGVGEGGYRSSCNSRFICCLTPSVLESKRKLGDHALQIMRMVEYRQEG